MDNITIKVTISGERNVPGKVFGGYLAWVDWGNIEPLEGAWMILHQSRETAIEQLFEQYIAPHLSSQQR